jgi:hypothetical protein
MASIAKLSLSRVTPSGRRARAAAHHADHGIVLAAVVRQLDRVSDR